MRRRIHPDTISSASIVASALAALCFWQALHASWLLLAGSALCYVRLWLNMLDGMVAIASRQASSRGEIWNEFPDRISDVLMFAGVAHSGLASPVSAYWAAMLSLLTAYMGTLGQAVAGRREFSGLMSKPMRVVALHIGATACAASLWTGGQASMAGFTILDWTCIAIVIGCIQTIVVRLRRTLDILAAAPASRSLTSNHRSVVNG